MEELICKNLHDSSKSSSLLGHLVQDLAKKTKPELKQIRETFNRMYGEDMIDHLQKRDGVGQGGVCGALAMWVVDPVESDTVMAREALDEQKGDFNYKALVEMFVGRKSNHIVLVKQAYFAKFRRHLDQDIASIEPPHPFKKILVALVASHKAHHVDVSQHIAKCDARRLFQTGERRAGAVDEAVVLELLSKRSIAQLKLTFSCYKHIYGHGYTKAIKHGNYGEFEDSLMVVIECICNPHKYYAKTIYGSMKGMMTRDKGALGRVMRNRAEVDMDGIQRAFKKKYGLELKEALCESIPSGDYRDFLLGLASRTTSNATTIF